MRSLYAAFAQWLLHTQVMPLLITRNVLATSPSLLDPANLLVRDEAHADLICLHTGAVHLIRSSVVWMATAMMSAVRNVTWTLSTDQL